MKLSQLPDHIIFGHREGRVNFNFLFFFFFFFLFAILVTMLSAVALYPLSHHFIRKSLTNIILCTFVIYIVYSSRTFPSFSGILSEI